MLFFPQWLYIFKPEVHFGGEGNGKCGRVKIGNLIKIFKDLKNSIKYYSRTIRNF